MNRICVFAGSNLGSKAEYQIQARKLGEEIAKNGLELVYGGSSVGLMGELANQVLSLGGKVIGVMPSGLFRGEVVHRGLSELIEVKDMHERKATMSRLADGYIALPGGFGTFEELFEAVCWAQLGIHQKPIGLFNIEGYYTPLQTMVRHAVESGFVKPSNEQLLITETDAQQLLNRMRTFTPPSLERKWK